MFELDAIDLDLTRTRRSHLVSEAREDTASTGGMKEGVHNLVQDSIVEDHIDGVGIDIDWGANRGALEADGIVD